MYTVIARIEKALEALLASLTNQGTVHMYKDVVAELKDAISALKTLEAVTGQTPQVPPKADPSVKFYPVKPEPKND